MHIFPFIPFRYSKTLTIAIGIMILCLLPSSEFKSVNMPITFADDIVHFTMFFVFSCAFYLDITKKRSGYRPFAVIIITILLSFGLGSVTELMQFIITPINRSGSIVDLMFDFIGISGGTLLAAIIKRKSSAAP
jgi:VanZ family protein